ncbi:MAG: hypothetical protein H7196_04675 [candidate division SR1 bacterium]|nr:hypothetical protein [candidate division SR1 bacterium]
MITYTVLSIIGFILPNLFIIETILETGKYDFSELFQSMIQIFILDFLELIWDLMP